MKEVILTSVFLLAAARMSMAGADAATQQLLIQAERQANVFSAETSPVQMEVDFVAQVLVPTHGHLTYRWEAKERWWRSISMEGFRETDLRNGEKLYIGRNASFTPVRIRELQNMVGFAVDPDRLEIKKQKQRVERGIAITCLQVRAKNAQSGAHEVCVNPSSHEILSEEWKDRPDGSHRREYSDYFEFRGHRYPRKIELFVNGIKAITAQVVSLTAAPLDQALLVPPKGAIERRQCEDMKHAVPLKTPDPMYPQSASQNRMMGDTTVAMTVFEDGSVGNIQVIGSSTHSMDDAALQTVKGWKFKPAMCGADPVVSDIEVVVSFRLR